MTTPQYNAPRTDRSGTWRIDPTTTTVSIAVKKMGLFTITGALAVTDGTITIDGDTVKVDVTADAASYDSPMTKRNEHVRSADFLDADGHPTIRFTGSGPLRTDTADQKVPGEVTIKGRTSPLDFGVTDIDVAGDRASFRATANADRHELGIDKMPAFVIGRSLDIEVEVHALR